MRYLPHTENEIKDMLARIGVKSVDALFESVPAKYRFDRPLNIGKGLDEATLMGHLEALSEKNTAARALSFLGGGMYDHHIPPAVDQLLLRSEFYTAYTPYQPEVSQGTLQAIFEFQTLVCEVLGMDVSNASMYDGASATAEAVLMARRINGRTRTILSAGLHPEYTETVHTYVAKQGITLTTANLAADGRTDLAAVAAQMGDDVNAIVVGYPNFFGCVEDLAGLRDLATKHGALLITATNEAYALSLLQPPGSYGVDIAVGEGQSLAVPPQFGGPGVGLFTCKTEYVRQMPGRLCGETVDASGKRGYVLTLSTREQHIRRERATSNICTNHGLIALAFAIRTAMLGKSGFKHIGEVCLANAEYLKKAIVATGKFTLPYSAPTFNEFVVRCNKGKASAVLAAIADKGVLGGIDLARFDHNRERDLLIAVTERHKKADLDSFVSLLAESAP